MVLVLIILFASVCYLYYYYKRSNVHRIHECLKDFPKPKDTNLLFGDALDFSNAKAILGNLLKYFKDVGSPIKIKIGPSKMYLISADHKFFEFVLNSQSIINKAEEYRFLHDWLGTGLLTSEKLKWKKRRRVLTPAFHFKILEQFIDIFDNTGDILIKKLHKEVGKPSVDIYKFCNLLTLDVICETAMGTSVKAQENSETNYVGYVRDMGRIVMDRIFSPIKTFDLLYPLTLDYYQQKRTLKHIHSFTYSVINKRRELLKDEPPVTIDDDVGLNRKVAFLDLLLQSTIDGKPLSDTDIREEVDTFMFEGHDTTGASLTFTLHLLAHHPEIQKKVYQEQLDVLGDLNRKVTYNDLQSMKYLEMVIKESLRLYPSVPIIGRRVKEDVEYEGKILPKGLNISLVIFAIHRNPEYFPDPDRFLPERFENPEFLKISPFIYVPFSAGPRNCIGQRFAMLELKCTLSKVLRNFELIPASPDNGLQLVAEIILKSYNGIQIALKRRVHPNSTAEDVVFHVKKQFELLTK